MVASGGEVKDTDGGREGYTWHNTNFRRYHIFGKFFFFQNLLHEQIQPLLEYFQCKGFHLFVCLFCFFVKLFTTLWEFHHNRDLFNNELKYISLYLILVLASAIKGLLITWAILNEIHLSHTENTILSLVNWYMLDLIRQTFMQKLLE